MAVDDILKKIKADAGDAARQIVSESRAEADALLDAAREKVAAEKARLEAKAQQRADEERNRIITLARLGARRELLSEKQRLIDRVFDETRKKVLSMGRDEYRAFISTVLKEALEPGDYEVLVGEGEDRIDQAFLDQAAREAGGQGKLTLTGERRAISGGLILRRGRIETNCSLDTIIRDARERLETEVAAILFGAEEK